VRKETEFFPTNPHQARIVECEIWGSVGVRTLDRLLGDAHTEIRTRKQLLGNEKKLDT